MGLFSNIIKVGKKVGKFVARVFRDVEKPVKETEKTVTKTAKVFEDIGLKAFRAFQKFIETPATSFEDLDEYPIIPTRWFKKIVKTGASNRRKKDTWENFYAITYEDNQIDRWEDLMNWLQENFPDKSFHLSGYESEIIETDEFPQFEYPEIEGGTE